MLLFQSGPYIEGAIPCGVKYTYNVIHNKSV
jgi:hypothetical protein